MVASPRSRDKTYQDYLALGEGVRAELIDGELFMSPQPKGRHVQVASLLTTLLGARFGLGAGAGRDGPGGWWILAEPECHLVPDRRVVVPDLAGWRRSRLRAPPRDSHKFELVPDWVCEVLSPSTAGHDTIVKMPRYLAAGVSWVWIVEPLARRVEVYRSVEGQWEPAGAVEGDGPARLAPFDAVELWLGPLWDEGPAAGDVGDKG